MNTYKKWISGIFGRSASTYGEGGSNYFTYFAEKLVDFADLSPGMVILDVATGRGAILRKAIEKIGPAGTAIGIDISHEMIAETSKDLKDKARLQIMDAEMLDFKDETFDVVFCGFGVFFFPHIEKALSEFYRVLKKNGKLVISTWQNKDVCIDILNQEIANFGVTNKITLHDFERPDYIEKMLGQARFKDIIIVEESFDHVYPTFDAWFSSLWSHGTRGKLEKLTPEQIEKLKSNLIQKLQPKEIHQRLTANFAKGIKE